MSKRKPTDDPRQATFGFFMPTPAETGKPEAQAEDFDLAIREAVAETLTAAARCAQAAMSRDDVAEAMTTRLGRRVSKTQLDQWSAPSQDDRRIPVDALRALGLVTGDWRALHVLVEGCGFKALTPEEAVCAEFGALAAVRRRIDGRSRELTKGMDDMVGGLLGRLKSQVAQ